MTPNQRGILLMTLGMAGFAVEDAFIKGATADLPSAQVLLTLGLGGGVVFSVAAWRRGCRL